MDNIYMLTDFEILRRIASRIKEIRLKQNMTQQSLARNAGVSLSSVIRVEDGNIKSFDTLVRILRTLGKLDIFSPLIEEEPLSPNEYYRLMNETKKQKRKRAEKSMDNKKQEEPEW